METDAVNYWSGATLNWGCTYPIEGCLDSRYTSFMDTATFQTTTEFCQKPGCTDSTNSNYDSIATYSDGVSCAASRRLQDADLLDGRDASDNRRFLDNHVGCLATSGALNYDSTAASDDGLQCVWATLGCTDSTYTDYNSEANAMQASGCTGQVKVNGCGSSLANNYDSNVNVHNASACTYSTYGCTDAAYTCYNSLADVDDGSCSSCGIEGCTNTESPCFNSAATADDGSCNNAGCIVIRGCINSQATNYQSSANSDDGSCVVVIAGCMDTTALNYDNTANQPDNAQCTYGVKGCTNSLATNYQSVAVADDGTCVVVVVGCMDTTALNYASSANQPDNTQCSYGVRGCTNSLASNYKAAANDDDGSCIIVKIGCMDSTALNYDNTATAPDNTQCTYGVKGCTDSTADNYLASAVGDDGTCQSYGCTATDALNYNSRATYPVAATAVGTGLCEMPFLGCTSSEAYNYNRNATGDDGTCTYAGCMDSLSLAYDQSATVPGTGANGGCGILQYGCVNTYAQNYDSTATADGGMCYLPGCTDSLAIGYESWAETNDGSCSYSGMGCTDSESENYNIEATYDNGQCIRIGCLDSTALNYDPLANTIGILCIAIIDGCMDSRATNYDAAYNYQSADVECLLYGCMDSARLNYVSWATYQYPENSIAEGACGPYIVTGCTDSVATNYDSAATVNDGSCIGGRPEPPSPAPPSPPSPPPVEYPTNNLEVDIVYAGLELSSYGDVEALLAMVASDFSLVEVLAGVSITYEPYSAIVVTFEVVTSSNAYVTDLSWFTSAIRNTLPGQFASAESNGIVLTAQLSEGRRLRRRLAGAGTITLTVDVPLSSDVLFNQAQGIQNALADDASWSAELATNVAAQASIGSISDPVSTPHVVAVVAVEAEDAADLDAATQLAKNALPNDTELAASVPGSFPGQTATVTTSIEIVSENLPPSLPPLPPPPLPPPLPSPPAPNNPRAFTPGVAPWLIAVIVLVVVLVLAAVAGGAYYQWKQKRKRVAQASVVPDVGERVVVAPPPLPNAPAPAEPAGGGYSEAPAPSSPEFRDRVPMNAPA